MARVPITVMGFRCERCGHEWIPRGGGEQEPRVCPKCRSPWWDRPKSKRSPMTYDDFKGRIMTVLTEASGPLTWTEIRTSAALPQLFPNNQWVHRMERDIGLRRTRTTDGTINWQLTKGAKVGEGDAKAAQTARKRRPRSRRK